MAPDSVITDEAAAKVKGQWITVLVAGQSVLGVVTDANALAEGRVLWVELEADEFPGLALDLNVDTTPVPDPETEIKLDWSGVRGTHINCEHDPAGINLENAMVCDGPLS
jgi:hypothetical protein